MITSRTGIAKLALLGYPRQKGKGLFGGGGDKVHVTLTCTLLDIPSWFFMYGVYRSVRVSTVNELEGEVQVCYYAAAVILLSILVPVLLLL